jgi:hypothetical protein
MERVPSRTGYGFSLVTFPTKVTVAPGIVSPMVAKRSIATEPKRYRSKQESGLVGGVGAWAKERLGSKKRRVRREVMKRGIDNKDKT